VLTFLTFFFSPLLLSFSSLFRYTLAVLSDLASKQGLTDITDDHIVAWANEKVRWRLCFFILSFTVCL